MNLRTNRLMGSTVAGRIPTHPIHRETFELNCSRTSLALDSTLVVVVEISLFNWLVCVEVPDLERRAMKKMSVDEAELLSQLHLGATRLRS